MVDTAGHGRVPAVEIMFFGPTVQKLVLEGEERKLPDAIRIGASEGMQDFTMSLKKLVTDELIDLVRGSRLTPIVVLHANHANELDAQVATAIGNFSGSGIMLLNQAVLLAGVNDSVEAQAALCERLVDLRVVPYYLHQLDPVAGAAHFEVPLAKGRQIIRRLRERLPRFGRLSIERNTGLAEGWEEAGVPDLVIIDSIQGIGAGRRDSA